MVTHSNTNLPVRSLCTGERTGPAAFSDLWSYVQGNRILAPKYPLILLRAHAILRLNLESQVFCQRRFRRAAEQTFLGSITLELPFQERHGRLTHPPRALLVVRPHVANVDAS
jgi:hypothetical protein